MRRRLTLALVGIALASIVFVGLGVASLAQIGAREEAVTQMSESLTAISEIDFRDGRGPADLGRLQKALEFDELEFVAVSADGTLLAPRQRRNNQGSSTKLTNSVTLNADQVTQLAAGEQIFIDQRGKVVGLQPIDLELGGPGFIPSLIAEGPVPTVSTPARNWFLTSAAGVLLLAAFVASWLAKRFTQPIASIENATRSIAGGDLDARVKVIGSDELAQLGESVNAMAADLSRSRELEQQFLMSITHDLRTPLTAIEGYAEALSDGAVDDPVKTGEVISNHAERLDRLVNDLLDLARLQARQFKLEMKPLDPAVAVGRTVAGLQPEAEDRGVRLSFQGDTVSSVMADPDRLSQIVGNLVSNGLKYAETAISVTVTPLTSASHPPMVRISIVDDGPGISPDDLPRVFERLYVTQQKPKRQESSSGLGLAIVRELTHAMGGNVSVASELGQGTNMVIDLPAH